LFKIKFQTRNYVTGVARNFD